MRLLLGIGLFLLLGCNTLPIGYEELGRGPDSDSLTLEPDTLASYGKYIPTGSSELLFLGRDGDYESRAIMRFPMADTALDSVTALQLILHPADSTPMNFVIRPCSSAWSATAVNWRMADSFNHWLRPGGDYWRLPLASAAFVGESLVIDLNLAYIDTLVHKSHGVILFSQDTGFVSISSRMTSMTAPRLRMRWAGGLERTYEATEDAYLVDTNDVPLPPGYLAVGSGVAFRTFVRFALDSVPVEATIARAELMLTPTVEYSRSETLGLGVRRLTESWERRGRNADFAATPAARLSYFVPADSDSVARIDISGLVQFWTAHPDSNFGLLITAEPEYSKMFRLRLPRSAAGAPKLSLLYTMPPRGRFQ